MDIRSKLAQEELEESLTPEERRALEEADGLFLRNAREFYEQIAQVADLEEMRRKSGSLPPIGSGIWRSSPRWRGSLNLIRKPWPITGFLRRSYPWV